MARRWICALLLAAVSGSASARSEAELRQCLQAYLPQKSLSLDVSLTQTGYGSQTQLRGTWLWRRDARGQSGVLRLTAPETLSGAAYLFRISNGQDELFMYLPSVGKVRQVNGATASQSLFGSGLSAFDLKLLLSGLSGGELQRLNEQAGEAGRPVERWRYRPHLEPDQMYDRIDFSVDVPSCAPLSADLYGGVPWKTLTVDAELQTADGRRMIERATLTDLRQSTTTRIEFSNIRFDEPLAEKRFEPGRFYR